MAKRTVLLLLDIDALPTELISDERRRARPTTYSARVYRDSLRACIPFPIVDYANNYENYLEEHVAESVGMKRNS